MEQRITDLELRYMHQERTVQELNETVFRMGRVVDTLMREVALLREQYRQISPSLTCDPGQEEPPPHY
ncbi:MAG TPA: SlyX family protein [Desulfuromonadales bacterium]|nr:SlyX family protein [Desulfuromonadales bacterium]